MIRYRNLNSGIVSYEVKEDGGLILVFKSGKIFSYKNCSLTKRMIFQAKNGKGLQSFINKNRTNIQRIQIEITGQ